MPTAAYGHSRSPAQPEWLPLLVQNLKIAFNANGAIAEYGHFCSCHEIPPFGLCVKMGAKCAYNKLAREAAEYKARRDL
jgi:hypothetical protein